MRRRIEAIVQRFRKEGATIPEKAMSAQELGLPPRFEEAMKRRLGQTGIFVEVDGKYYLNEARLGQMEQQRLGAMGIIRRNMMTLRIARMIVGALALITLLTNFFVRNVYVWILIVSLIVVWLILTVLQIYYVARMRGRRSGFSATDDSSLGIQAPP